jgi:hypothetical protein
VKCSSEDIDDVFEILNDPMIRQGRPGISRRSVENLLTIPMRLEEASNRVERAMRAMNPRVLN